VSPSQKTVARVRTKMAMAPTGSTRQLHVNTNALANLVWSIVRHINHASKLSRFTAKWFARFLTPSPHSS
jgi:hypothetical protein